MYRNKARIPPKRNLTMDTGVMVEIYAMMGLGEKETREVI